MSQTLVATVPLVAQAVYRTMSHALLSVGTALRAVASTLLVHNIDLTSVYLPLHVTALGHSVLTGSSRVLVLWILPHALQIVSTSAVHTAWTTTLLMFKLGTHLAAPALVRDCVVPLAAVLRGRGTEMTFLVRRWLITT